MSMTMMKKSHLIMLSLLGGVILSLGWPVRGFPVLLFTGLIPFLLIEDHILRNRVQFGRVSVFLYTYPGFLLWNVLTTWWIWNSTEIGAILAFVLNAMFMSLVFHVYHITRKRLTAGYGFFLLVFYWITFEYIHHNWDGTWPWLSLGNGLATYIKWIQWYEFTGIYGGAVWILTINILLFTLLKDIIAKQSWVRLLVKSAATLILFVLPIVTSLILFNQYEEDYRPVDIVIVQPNIDPYNAQYNLPPSVIMDINLGLANQELDGRVDYLVLPESAIQEGIWERQIDRSSSLNRLKNFSAAHEGLGIVIGASTRREYHEQEQPSATARKFRDTNVYYDSYNTAFYIHGQEEIRYYHKSKLTPGVEKMPFPEIFKPLERFAINLGGTIGSLGTDKEPMVFTRSRDSLKIAPVICYESVYGEYLTDYIRKGAHLIFVITNDGWWGDTPGYRQHFTFSQLRAIETRRSVARSANTGTSAFISQRGEALQMTAYWEPAVIRQNINANDKITFYVRYGDYIARICTYVSALLLLITISRSITGKRKRIHTS